MQRRQACRGKPEFRVGSAATGFLIWRSVAIQGNGGLNELIARDAFRIGAEKEVPCRLANCRLQFRMKMLPFRQHAGPVGHVAEIPSGGERVRIPGAAPDMPVAVAGRGFDPPSGIARPGLLGLRVIRLLLFTGARSSEITGLRWDWIRNTRAVLRDSKTGPKTIQLPPPAQAVLYSLPRTSRFVFPDSRGTAPMTDLGRRWLKLRAFAGLDGVRIHDARHTFASHAVMSGLDLYTVGRLLGHADSASTERYAHLEDEHVREAAGRISGIVGAAMSSGRKREG